VLDLIHILWCQPAIGFNIVNKLKLKRYNESDTEYKETITVITILNMRKNSEKVGTVLQKITLLFRDKPSIRNKSNFSKLMKTKIRILV
jgi:hypothetical protein